MADSKVGFDRKIEVRSLHDAKLDPTRQSTPVDTTARSTPQLEMKWIVVTENGKRCLRMQWSVPAKSSANRRAA